MFPSIKIISTDNKDLSWGYNVPHFLRQAYIHAYSDSDDRETKVGAVLTGRDSHSGLQTFYGANRLPRGIVFREERVSRPLKSNYLEHAERNVIYKLIDQEPLTNKVLYAPWFACADCAKAIIAADIGCVIGHKTIMDMTPPRWKDSIDTAITLLQEAGVKLYLYDGKIGGCKAFFDTKEWFP
jgi:deoxycytidylate deaminase